MGIKDYKIGETVRVFAGDEEIGFAKIEDVKLVRWKDIKDEDVLIEGMRRKKDLKRELNKIYGDFDEDSLFTQVIFRMLKMGKNKRR